MWRGLPDLLIQIHKTREGERSFQDQENYRAWHVVEYHRFIRFLPGGQVDRYPESDVHHLAKLPSSFRGCHDDERQRRSCPRGQAVEHKAGMCISRRYDGRVQDRRQRPGGCDEESVAREEENCQPW